MAYIGAALRYPKSSARLYPEFVDSVRVPRVRERRAIDYDVSAVTAMLDCLRL